MKTIMKFKFFFLFVLLALRSCQPATASIITANLTDATGNPAVKFVRFQPRWLYKADGVKTALGVPIRANADASNNIAATISIGGAYDVYFGNEDKLAPLRVLIPVNDTNTWTLNQVAQLAVNAAMFDMANIVITNIVISDGVALTNNAPSAHFGTVTGDTVQGGSGSTLGNWTFVTDVDGYHIYDFYDREIMRSTPNGATNYAKVDAVNVLNAPWVQTNDTRVLSLTNAANQFTGTFTGNGGNLTGLNGDQVATGTVADVRLSTNVTLRGIKYLASTNGYWQFSLATDGSTNATFVLTNTGSAVIPSGNFAGTFSGSSTGSVYATDGNVVTNTIRRPDFVAARYPYPITNVFWGDSLTAGSGTTSAGFPEQIASSIGSVSFNMGISGSDSSGIFNGGGNSSLYAVCFTNFPNYWSLPTVIWSGNNDGIVNSNTTLLNISNMVSRLTTTNYLVLGLVGNTNQTYAYMLSLVGFNQRLKSIYTNHYLDPQLVLSNAQDGSVLDAYYTSNFWAPKSLLADHIHLNTNGYAVLAKAILASGLQDFGSVPTRAAAMNDTYRMINNRPAIFTSELGGSGLSDGLLFDCPLGQTNGRVFYDRSRFGAVGTPSTALFDVVSSPDGIGLRTMSAIASAVDFSASWFQTPLTNFTFDILAINTNQFNSYFALNSVGTGNPAFQFNLNTNGNGILAKFVSGGANKFVNGTCPFSVYDGKWHQYTFTYDGATERVYADGVEVGNAANTGVPDVPAASTYWLFGNTDGKGLGIAHPRIWTRALGAKEIEQLAISRGLQTPVLIPMTTAPVGITNGLSKIWNSNGVATYLRTSTVGSATSTDTKLGP